MIDEQHRFGVEERLLMGRKGATADVLVMTATPIPRTLLLTQWGEMQVSRLDGKARRPQAGAHDAALAGDAARRDRRHLSRARGRRARLLGLSAGGRSEVFDVAAAEARFASCATGSAMRSGWRTAGRIGPVREAALADSPRRTRLLVATTVIEVGVDVPEASVMVVEHAERFGLAQLHQLRGRVGRGRDASFCLLLHEDGLNETAKRRLLLLRDTEDGFRIADEDFRLRGGGDLLGTRQSGAPGWRLADPVEDEGLLHMAGRDAELLLQKDPKLVSERGRPCACCYICSSAPRRCGRCVLVSGWSSAYRRG